MKTGKGKRIRNEHDSQDGSGNVIQYIRDRCRLVPSPSQPIFGHFTSHGLFMTAEVRIQKKVCT